jgi:hypothetical protein
LQEVSGYGSNLADVKILASSRLKEMTRMKRLVMATALSCVFFGSVMAGDVPTGDYPPPSSDEMTTVVVLGDIPSGGYTQEDSTEITLTMVQAILSLFSV